MPHQLKLTLRSRCYSLLMEEFYTYINPIRIRLEIVLHVVTYGLHCSKSDSNFHSILFCLFVEGITIRYHTLFSACFQIWRTVIGGMLPSFDYESDKCRRMSRQAINNNHNAIVPLVEPVRVGRRQRSLVLHAPCKCVQARRAIYVTLS